MHHDAPQQFFLGHITSMVNDPDHMDRLFKSGDQRCQIWAVVEQPLPDEATRSKDIQGSTDVEHQHIPMTDPWCW